MEKGSFESKDGTLTEKGLDALALSPALSTILKAQEKSSFVFLFTSRL